MGKRTYGQDCALAHALDIVGERWTLLIIRELLIGPRRFKDLLEALRGIGTNLLANRLKELEQAGLLEKTILPPPAGSSVYQLTPRGEGLEEAISALVRWGMQLPAPGDRTNFSRPEWDIVALRAIFDITAARELRFTVQFEVDGVAYYAEVDHGDLNVELGHARRRDVRLVTDRDTLGALGRDLSWQDAQRLGKLHVEGNERVLNDLLRAFPASETVTSMPKRSSIDHGTGSE